MYNKSKTAVEILMNGYMCSEAVTMAFADEFGLKPDLAAKISAGLAGGLAQGNTCGVVIAAILVIGLKFGEGLTRDLYSKELCFQMTQEFSYRFKKRRQTLACHEILLMNQVDPADPAQMKNLREKKICDKIVRDAVEILEEIFSE